LVAAWSVCWIWAAKLVATYWPDTDWTYDKSGNRIGTGNRLAGMVEDDQ
jgi:hypothetical protein